MTGKNSGLNTVVLIITLVFILIGLLWVLSSMNVYGIPFLGTPHVQIGDTSGLNWFGSLKIDFQIYNSGNADAKNVEATVALFENESSISPLETKQIFIGNLAPGESKTLTVKFQGNYPETLKFRITPWTRS